MTLAQSEIKRLNQLYDEYDEKNNMAARLYLYQVGNQNIMDSVQTVQMMEELGEIVLVPFGFMKVI